MSPTNGRAIMAGSVAAVGLLIGVGGFAMLRHPGRPAKLQWWQAIGPGRAKD